MLSFEAADLLYKLADDFGSFRAVGSSPSSAQLLRRLIQEVQPFPLKPTESRRVPRAREEVLVIYGGAKY